VNRRELNDHPRARRAVESVCQPFVSLLNETEDGRVALMMGLRIIANDRPELVENTLAESL